MEDRLTKIRHFREAHAAKLAARPEGVEVDQSTKHAFESAACLRTAPRRRPVTRRALAEEGGEG